MADTLPNIVLPAGVWVDLYDSTGIIVGRQISVQNLGTTVVWLTSQAATPTAGSGRNEMDTGVTQYVNDDGDSGAWARSNVLDGLINVRIA